MAQQKEILKRLFTLLEKYSEKDRDDAFLNYQSPADLAKLLELDREQEEGNWDELFSWIEKYLQYGVDTAHPAFVNRMWAGANPPSILGDMVAAATNTSACTFESAPVSTLMEKYMIDEMLALVGFDSGEGQMTTGSSNANMIAMMCARNLAGESVKAQGLFGQQPLVAFVNSEAHYSMDKAANILGIGSNQLVKVAINSRGEMVPEALEEALKKVVAEGGRPFFVAATQGTTVRGAYDPIMPLLKLRERYGFWLHADGAWGGAAIMSNTLKSRFMDGLDQVNSFTCDFHKMLGSALMCNVLLINSSHHTLGRVLGGGDGSYLFRDTEDAAVTDLGTASLQCGRRVDSLKWFLDWKYYGKAGFARRIEKYLSLCEYAEELLKSYPELEMVSPRTSFNICFRFRAPEEHANTFNQELRTRLYRQAQALVGIAFIGEKLVMRLLVTNTSVGKEELRTFFDQLVTQGRALARERENGCFDACATTDVVSGNQ